MCFVWGYGFAGFDLAKNEKLVCCSRSIAVPPRFHSSGGSSAVEQRTVKCASAAILWSGVQISLSGFFIFAKNIFFSINKKRKLRNGESNPGHLRDRQRCYQLHHIGVTLEYLGFDPSTSCLLSTHASDCANTPEAPARCPRNIHHVFQKK